MNRFFKAAALALGLLFWTNAGVSEAAQADMARASGLRVYAAQPGDNFVLLSARLGYDAEFLAALNNLSAGVAGAARFCVCPLRRGLTLRRRLRDGRRRRFWQPEAAATSKPEERPAAGFGRGPFWRMVL